MIFWFVYRCSPRLWKEDHHPFSRFHCDKSQYQFQDYHILQGVEHRVQDHTQDHFLTLVEFFSLCLLGEISHLIVLGN